MDCTVYILYIVSTNQLLELDRETSFNPETKYYTDP